MSIFVRRRKTETTTITREFVRIRRPPTAITAWCRQCGYETQLLPPEDAADFAGITTRQIYRGVEVGCLHYAELSRGSLLICLNSINLPDHPKFVNESLT